MPDLPAPRFCLGSLFFSVITAWQAGNRAAAASGRTRTGMRCSELAPAGLPPQAPPGALSTAAPSAAHAQHTQQGLPCPPAAAPAHLRAQRVQRTQHAQRVQRAQHAQRAPTWVVSMMPAMEQALVSPERVTLAGSSTPASIRFSTRSYIALYLQGSGAARHSSRVQRSAGLDATPARPYASLPPSPRRQAGNNLRGGKEEA